MINKKYLFLDDDYSDRHQVLFFEEYVNCIRDRNVIDIGCGVGNTSEYFEDWTGITSNKSEVEEGKRRCRNIYHIDAHRLSDRFVNRFTGAIMWDSLEHFVSPYIALSECRLAMKEGGLLLIFMPGRNWLNAHNHIHTMDYEQMKHLLKRTNWKVLESFQRNYPDTPQYAAYNKLDHSGMAIYLCEKDSYYVPKFPY